jgi:hypothetical protein
MEINCCGWPRPRAGADDAEYVLLVPAADGREIPEVVRPN